MLVVKLDEELLAMAGFVHGAWRRRCSANYLGYGRGRDPNDGAKVLAMLSRIDQNPAESESAQGMGGELVVATAMN